MRDTGNRLLSFSTLSIFNFQLTSNTLRVDGLKDYFVRIFKKDRRCSAVWKFILYIFAREINAENFSTREGRIDRVQHHSFAEFKGK